jgi:hypothetical protein
MQHQRALSQRRCTDRSEIAHNVASDLFEREAAEKFEVDDLRQARIERRQHV